jgi:[glutamine synthetase] adenylyltransferase / [glutamine synthetase]-adenylyl-L-tyrosine phosphorylase
MHRTVETGALWRCNPNVSDVCPMPTSPLTLALACADDTDVPAALARLGFDDTEAAQRHLTALAARLGEPPFAVPLLEALLGHLAECPDADMALNNFDRWSAQLPGFRGALAALLENARLFADLVTVFGSSQYLADILVREPTGYALLQENVAGAKDVGIDARAAEVMAPFQRPAARLEALRRLKRREFLRIGWRDYTGRWGLPEVVAAVSELADGLIRGALEVAKAEVVAKTTRQEEIRFAVIAMGKLGGRELNYSSDVDLLFVYESVTNAAAVDSRQEAAPPLTTGNRQPATDERELRFATRVAEGLVSALSSATHEGQLFRVDMRLRPEGRFGALVRSLASYREYYDRWIETWERQALLKARFVAGDADLGRRFAAMIEPRVYRRTLSTAIFEDVRDVKQAIERRVAGAGQAATNVKEGRGTIRDIEFAVQLLQLLFGGAHAEMRTGSTLEAMDRLAATGLLTAEERDTLREHYLYFRAVEHRLQLMDDLPVRLVPEGGRDRDRLARRMGFPRDAGAAFAEDYRRRSDAVYNVTQEIFQRLSGEGSGPEGALRPLILAIREGNTRAALRAELAQRGFGDPERAAAALESLATGGTRYSLPVTTRRQFSDLAETLVTAAAASPDPEAALAAFAEIAHRSGAHRTLYQTLAEAPATVAALCRITGSSPRATEMLLRHPEWREMLFDPEFLSQPRSLEALLDETRSRLAAARAPVQRRNGLRRFQQRERLRIIARDLLLDTEIEGITAELALLAEVCLRVALADRWEAADMGGFAVIGLGRLGGRELHYGSDLDLLYLFDPARHPEHPSHRAYEELAAELTRSLTAITEEGTLYEVDLRLRPEGKSGFVAAHIDAYRQYYRTRAQTWELQSLTRARVVAGDARVAEEFLEWVTPLVYPETPPPERDDAVRAMKRRIETERVSTAERARHLKLGPGGLSDVEFLVQMLQMRHAGREPELRQPNTLAALEALTRAGHLTDAEHAALRDGYRFLTRLRQRLTLASADVAPETLPTEPSALRRVARSMGFADGEALLAAHARVTESNREVFGRRFLG